MFVGLAVLVVVNAAISLAVARGGRGTNSALVAFGLRVVLNVVLVLLAQRGARCAPPGPGAALFFVVMLSLITLLDDRYRPVQVARLAEAGHPRAAPAT